MGNLYALIEKIKKRPSMYLGRRSISNLRSCIAGYILARRELGIPQTEQEREFVEFQEWIKNKFNITSSQSWDSIILFYSEDERNALDRFFDLFEEFLQAKKKDLKIEQIDSQHQSKLVNRN
jgi:hypothetical protein